MLDALNSYYKSVNLYPYEGKYYFLLSSMSIKNGEKFLHYFQLNQAISHFNEDFFNSIYWCVRAYSSIKHFNCKEELQEMLQENRKIFNSYAKTQTSDQRFTKDENFRLFSIYFLRFFTIIFTQIGYEELEDMKNMFPFLNEYLFHIRSQSLTRSSPEQAMKDVMLLKAILEITIFSVFFSVEGYSLQDKWTEQKLEEQINDQSNINNDAMTKKCLQFARVIFTNIVEFLNIFSQIDDCFQEVLYPLLYFMISYPQISKYLLAQKAFYNSLNRLYNTFSKKLNQSPQRKQAEKCVDTMLLRKIQQCDTYLISFWPTYLFFKKFKSDVKVLDALPKQALELKLAYTLRLISEIQEFKASETVDEFLDYDYPEIQLPGEPRKWKGIIVIDGSNVGMRFSESNSLNGEIERGKVQVGFCKGIEIAVKFWIDKSYEPVVLLPDYCFRQEEIDKRLNRNEVKVVPDNVDVLRSLQDQKIAFGIPNWDHDDSYMIDYAQQKGAFILTNDRYNDHINKEKEKVDQEQLKQWVRNNSISFSFIQDDIFPNPEFLKNRGIK